MYNLTEQDLQAWGTRELIELVLEQQKLLKQCNDVLTDAINTLESVKEMAQ